MVLARGTAAAQLTPTQCLLPMMTLAGWSMAPLSPQAAHGTEDMGHARPGFGLLCGDLRGVGGSPGQR